MKTRPDKPYPDFPLFPHRNGQWAKKIKGRMTYYGPWADWRTALRKYQDAGDGDSLQAAVDRYVESRRLLTESGEMSTRHLADIERTLKGLCATAGGKSVSRVTSQDYGVWRAKLAKTNGPVALGNHIMRVRAFLNWCRRERIICQLPETDALKKPSRAQLRRARAARGSRMFEPDEVQRLLQCAPPQMRAMILLALNAGLGNNDLAQLRTHNLQGGWLDYPRPKTGVERRVPLWSETVAALAALDSTDLVFVTKYGNAWTPKNKTDSPISAAFAKLCKGLGIHKPGRGFYSLRHTCQTVGEEAGDRAAIEYILGHIPHADDMSAVYRERMSDARLLRVANYIRAWVFKRAASTAQESAGLAASVVVEVLEPSVTNEMPPSLQA